MPYAEKTKVPILQSQGEIERIVIKHGGDQFMCGWREEHAIVAFRVNGRMLRFTIPITEGGSLSPGGNNQQRRRLWRALLLAIKAKFEIVESGIETFDNAFLSNVVMHDGSTMGEWAAPQVALMYERGEMPPLLPGPSNS